MEKEEIIFRIFKCFIGRLKNNKIDNRIDYNIIFGIESWLSFVKGWAFILKYKNWLIINIIIKADIINLNIFYI